MERLREVINGRRPWKRRREEKEEEEGLASSSSSSSRTMSEKKWVMMEKEEALPKNVHFAVRDEDLDEILVAHGGKKTHANLVVVDYTARWCRACQAALPRFFAAARSKPRTSFAVADVDGLHRYADDFAVAPTFAFYKNGRKVDELLGLGGDEEKAKRLLLDRCWLHDDASHHARDSAQRERRHDLHQRRHTRRHDGVVD